MTFSHTPVMLKECIDALCISPEGIYVDGTAGGGGHSYSIAQRLKTGSLIAIDQDADAIAAATAKLAPFGHRVKLIKDNFRNIKGILRKLDIAAVDGAILDLGVSSYQLDEPSRGFSYMADAPLDMRMDREASVSACDVVNSYSEEDLTRILYTYGEERWAKRIARFIVERRKKQPVVRTSELVDIISAAIPGSARQEGGHPAKRTFQAIRIEVNGELTLLRQAIVDFVDCLKPGGRLCVITFHSLEDRIVKEVFAELAKGCVCPREFPVCVCGRTPQLKLITKRPIVAGDLELRQNTRAKSAKLRVAEKR